MQILTKSPDDRGDRSAVVNLQSLAPGDFQPPGIQPQLLQDGGMDVGDVVTVFDRMEPDFIGGPCTTPPLMPPPAIHTLNP